MAKKKKSGKKGKVFVQRQALVNLFKALGFSEKSIKKWNDEKLLSKVMKLPETTKSVKIHKKAARDFLKKLLKVTPLTRINIKGSEKKVDKEIEKAIADKKAGKDKPEKKKKQPDRVVVTTNILAGLPNAGLTITQLEKKCDTEFVKQGGKETMKEAACCLRRTITCLKLVKVVKQDGNRILPAKKR